MSSPRHRLRNETVKAAGRWSFSARLALVHALGLLGLLGCIPTGMLMPDWMSPSMLAVLVYYALLGLAPVPAVAAAILLARDHGWRRGLYGVPAAILAATLPGLWNLVRIAVTEGKSL